MARPIRLEYPGAVYHVMARGHERGRLFREDRDRNRWLELLGLVASGERWSIHAFCLMSNHYHLLVETPQGRLSAGMHALNARYAQWFNRCHNRRGHLFEARFRGVLVQRESHLLELCRYVVLNPVRARVVRSAGEWVWSSYRATAGLETGPGWLEVDWTLGQFAPTRRIAQAAYRRFVAHGKGVPSPLEGVTAQVYLGDETFLRDLHRLAEAHRRDSEIPLRQRRPSGPSLDGIRKAVAEEWGVPVAELSRPRRGDPKIAAIYLAHVLTQMKVREIGSAFGVRSARVSNIVRQVREGRNRALTKRIARLEASVTNP